MRGIGRRIEWGFTLVELLIVVAIIAILAAIAVPNFVQAQVRSRVSAVEMDMRSIAVGLESYRVDFNRYPEPPPPSATIADKPYYAQIVLTTPVVYISQYMDDPFVKGYPINDFRKKIHYGLITFSPDSSYHEMWLGNPVGQYNTADNQTPTWALASAGPDLVRSFSSNAGKTLVQAPFYDPTNGTPSPGDVIRTNMGVREVIIQMPRH